MLIDGSPRRDVTSAMPEPFHMKRRPFYILTQQIDSPGQPGVKVIVGRAPDNKSWPVALVPSLVFQTPSWLDTIDRSDHSRDNLPPPMLEVPALIEHFFELQAGKDRRAKLHQVKRPSWRANRLASARPVASTRPSVGVETCFLPTDWCG